MKSHLKDRFEKWAFLQGFDISMQSDGTYTDPLTVAAKAGYFSATKYCKEICVETALYYGDGTSAATAATRCADNIECEE